jgi:small-conductance mechanosensitive channel
MLYYLERILNWNFYGNSGKDYLIFLFTLIGALIILEILQKVVLMKLKKAAKATQNNLDDVLVDIIYKIKPPFYFIVSFYLAFQFLNINIWLDKAITFLFLLALVYESIRVVSGLIKIVVYRMMKRNSDDVQAKATVKTLNIFVQIILWSLGLLLVLANMGINITSLIAGLGIGGIAVALALQNILTDVFSSFSILIDKPFQVGDFIKIGKDTGVVEKIGIKTTRLRTLDGQLLIVSNQDLTKTRVENFQQLQRRRALFTLGVVYETSREQLEDIPQIIKDIVENKEKAILDRCHFKSYGDFSLNVEVSIYIDVTNYNEFLDVLQSINLDIFSHFKEKGISFAYPTQFLYQKTV